MINCLGMKASSILSTLGALIGTILPMVFIIGLGIFWVMQDRPLQIELSWAHFFPDNAQSNNLAFLTNVLFGLLGLGYGGHTCCRNAQPSRDYPRSLFVSCIIILATIILASLAIAIVVPKRTSLATGVMQAFAVFVQAFNLPWLLPVIAGCIILGGLSGVGAWVIGPTKGLLVACHDGSLPSFLGKTNKKGVPVKILLIQAVVVSVLSLAFILLPTVNSSFWLLSAMTAQLALISYIALFASAIKLHYHKAHIPRHFRIPGKKIGLWTICSSGTFCCVIVILLGFFPPSEIPFHSIIFYETILIGGIGLFCLLPCLIFKRLSVKS